MTTRRATDHPGSAGRGSKLQTIQRAERLGRFKGALSREEMADATGIAIDTVAYLCRRFRIPFAESRYRLREIRDMKAEDRAAEHLQREIQLARVEAPRTPPHKRGKLEW